MHAPMMTLEVTTHLYGLGAERRTPPVYVVLTERTLPARALIAEHVRGEVQRTEHSRTASLALHYILADDLRASPAPAASALDVDAEIARLVRLVRAPLHAGRRWYGDLRPGYATGADRVIDARQDGGDAVLAAVCRHVRPL